LERGGKSFTAFIGEINRERRRGFEIEGKYWPRRKIDSMGPSCEGGG